MADVLSIKIECEKIAEEILNNPILDGKSLKELTEEVKKYQWIPAKERLPEEYTYVLCWYEYYRYGDFNGMDETYGVGFYGTGHWGGDVRGHKVNVIAWMPLPEPYKGEE